MSVLAALRDWPSKGAEECCSQCAHFHADPAALEAALPGLAILSSAHASVRSEDGLCLRQDRMTNGLRRCPDFAPTAR